ncbi:MAG: hypothetical protein K8T90_13570 [Planctomycetes bacterium]|nr:hypothetical protein [Planctomycetota bacterium]
MHHRTDHRAQRLGIVAAGLASAIAAQSFGQEGATPERATDPRRTPLPDLTSPRATFEEPAQSTAGLQFSNLRRVTLAVDGDDLVVQAEMQRDLLDSMFTLARMDFDCDGRRQDEELSVTASIGSRYRPLAYEPRDGFPAPFALARASWASPFDERRDRVGARRTMTNWDSLAKPEVGGNRLRFRVPLSLPLDRGVRSATSAPNFRLTVRTTCSEHPVAFDYDALDAGRAIVVDGRTEEWSGGPWADDPAGELHEVLQHLDIRSVWCEHGPETVFVRVDFAAPGFGTVRRGDGDVQVGDSMTVRLEPRGEAYMQPVEVTVPATVVKGSDYDSKAAWVSGTGTVEVAIPRSSKQTRFRVVVWTDGSRVDELDGPWQVLPLTDLPAPGPSPATPPVPPAGSPSPGSGQK